MNEIIALAVAAIFYGLTMKMADLLNEHGLKWFRGSSIVFGFAWGVFGALIIVIGGPTIGNIVLAMNIAFIIRNRLDYFNHQLAATIIIIAFLWTTVFNINVFLVFYFIFLIFGSVKDYAGDVLKKTGWLATLNEMAMLYYPVPTFIYSFLYKEWLVFEVFILYILAYDLVKYIYAKKGYK